MFEFTMTTYWMLGIMGMMCLFGIAAFVFHRLGAKGRAPGGEGHDD